MVDHLGQGPPVEGRDAVKGQDNLSSSPDGERLYLFSALELLCDDLRATSSVARSTPSFSSFSSNESMGVPAPGREGDRVTPPAIRGKDRGMVGKAGLVSPLPTASHFLPELGITTRPLCPASLPLRGRVICCGDWNRGLEPGFLGSIVDFPIDLWDFGQVAPPL